MNIVRVGKIKIFVFFFSVLPRLRRTAIKNHKIK